MFSPYKETFTEQSLANDPALFTTMRVETQMALLLWIEHVMEAADTKYKRSSYEFKHDFEWIGFYITNGMVKGAMLVSGYQPVAREGYNWFYNIRPKHQPSNRGTQTPGARGASQFLLPPLEASEQAFFDATLKRALSVPLCKVMNTTPPPRWTWPADRAEEKE